MKPRLLHVIFLLSYTILALYSLLILSALHRSKPGSLVLQYKEAHTTLGILVSTSSSKSLLLLPLGFFFFFVFPTFIELNCEKLTHTYIILYVTSANNLLVTGK